MIAGVDAWVLNAESWANGGSMFCPANFRTHDRVIYNSYVLTGSRKDEYRKYCK